MEWEENGEGNDRPESYREQKRYTPKPHPEEKNSETFRIRDEKEVTHQ
jgi:hypothetical protein